MSKKNRKDKSVCLHCVFIDAHKAKWPDWSKDKSDSGEAFQDFISSASQIATEALSMLGPMDQMKFMRKSFLGATRLRMGDANISIDDAIGMYEAAFGTKH